MNAFPTALGGNASRAAAMAGSADSSPASRCQSAAGPACRRRRAHQVDRLAGLGGGRPLAGRPVLTVHDDVQRDLAGLDVDVPDGEGAHRGPLLRGQTGEAVQGERLGKTGDVHVVGDERQLDVGVGELAGHEGVKILAPQHHPHHVRGELLGTDNFEALQRSTCHVSSCPTPDPPRLYEPRR
ncbi:siderophore utilization domain protein [Mycobacterium intracellulare]|nr:siderophore utilization domain protein [Mycobacterium intracellulare]